MSTEDSCGNSALAVAVQHGHFYSTLLLGFVVQSVASFSFLGHVNVASLYLVVGIGGLVVKEALPVYPLQEPENQIPKPLIYAFPKCWVSR